jgi:hypothetical protein
MFLVAEDERTDDRLQRIEERLTEALDRSKKQPPEPQQERQIDGDKNDDHQNVHVSPAPHSR